MRRASRWAASVWLVMGRSTERASPNYVKWPTLPPYFAADEQIRRKLLSVTEGYRMFKIRFLETPS
jgi:hypothetical protein